MNTTRLFLYLVSMVSFSAMKKENANRHSLFSFCQRWDSNQRKSKHAGGMFARGGVIGRSPERIPDAGGAAENEGAFCFEEKIVGFE